MCIDHGIDWVGENEHLWRGPELCEDRIAYGTRCPGLPPPESPKNARQVSKAKKTMDYIRVTWCDSPGTCQAELDKVAQYVHNEIGVRDSSTAGDETTQRALRQRVWNARHEYFRAAEYHGYECARRQQEGLGKINSMRSEMGEVQREDPFLRLDYSAMWTNGTPAQISRTDELAKSLTKLEQTHRHSVALGTGGLNVQRSPFEQYNEIKKHAINHDGLQKLWKPSDATGQPVVAPGQGPAPPQQTLPSASSTSQIASQYQAAYTQSSTSHAMGKGAVAGLNVYEGQQGHIYPGTSSASTGHNVPTTNQQAPQPHEPGETGLRIIRGNLDAKIKQLEGFSEIYHLDKEAQSQHYIDRVPKLRQISAECFNIQKMLTKQKPIEPDFPQSTLERMDSHIRSIREMVRTEQEKMTIFFNAISCEQRETLLSVVEMQGTDAYPRRMDTQRNHRVSSRSQSPQPEPRSGSREGRFRERTPPEASGSETSFGQTRLPSREGRPGKALPRRE